MVVSVPQRLIAKPSTWSSSSAVAASPPHRDDCCRARALPDGDYLIDAPQPPTFKWSDKRRFHDSCSFHPAHRGPVGRRVLLLISSAPPAPTCRGAPSAILDSVQGPVAKIVAVIIIIVTGLTLAFGETAGGFRRLIQIVFGLSIAFAASSFFLSFFSFGGGALVQ